MKGLFLDNFFKTIGGMKLLLFLVLIVGIAVTITGNDTALRIFVYLSITALSVTAVASMRKDADVKWNKYELTLPVTRKVIIKSKYVSYLFWVLIGTIIAAVFIALAHLFHGNIFFAYGVQDIASLFGLGIGIAILVGALFFPLAYLVGIDKSEVLLVISIIGGIGLAFLFVWLINQGDIADYYVELGIFDASCVLLFAISYFATNDIYKNREF